MKRYISSLVILFVVTGSLVPVPVSASVRGIILRRVIQKAGCESAEHEAKRGAVKVMRHEIMHHSGTLVKKYGDDVIKVVKGPFGHDILKATAKHGDEVMKIAVQVSPKARGVLAERTAEMLVMVRRHGVVALEAEAKAPRAGGRLFNLFDRKAATKIAGEAPPSDIYKLVKAAEKTNSKYRREYIARGYKKEGRVFLDKLRPGHIVAGGFAVGIVDFFHGASAPLRAIAGRIEQDKDFAGSSVTKFVVAGAIVVALILIFVFPVFRKIKYLVVKVFRFAKYLVHKIIQLMRRVTAFAAEKFGLHLSFGAR
jgi:hypothetical protein